MFGNVAGWIGNRNPIEDGFSVLIQKGVLEFKSYV